MVVLWCICLECGELDGLPSITFSCAVCYGGFVVHLFGVWRVMGSLNQVLLFASYGANVVHLWSVALDGLPSINLYVRRHFGAKQSG
jgi:hypothetical protein